MTEQMYYSTKTLGFYSSSYPNAAIAAGLSEDDMTPISREDYENLFNPPEGKFLVFDEKGPRLETLAPANLEAQAEVTRQQLQSEVQSATYTLNAKLLLGRTLNAAEKSRFNAWLDYSDMLNALDLSAAPDIEWPTKPD